MTRISGSQGTESSMHEKIMVYFHRRPVDESSGENWPLYTKAEPNYFILHAEKRGTGKGPRAHTCAFWNEFMPVITTGTSPRKNYLLSSDFKDNKITMNGSSHLCSAFFRPCYFYQLKRSKVYRIPKRNAASVSHLTR